MKYPAPFWLLWQYAQNGVVDGIKDKVDLNWAQPAFSTLRNKVGYQRNSQKKPECQKSEKPFAVQSKTVKP